MFGINKVFNDGLPMILPPRDDAIFKKIMTSEETRPALKGLISAVVGYDISEILMVNSELPKSNYFEKGERFDVNCKTDTGEQINIEMQANPMTGDNSDNTHENFRSRIVLYLTDLFAKQDKQKVYSEYKKTYCVAFCDYTIWKDEQFIRKFYLTDENGIKLSDKICAIVIELDKIGKLIEKKNVAEMTATERWAFYLKCIDNPDYEKTFLELIEREEAFKVATNALTSISKNEQFIRKFYLTDENGIKLSDKICAIVIELDKIGKLIEKKNVAEM
ncbi:MAG: Rpn family recombination-promoting nuclease/putative transposase, partial [Oscillospiraceae bacterium]|nr:Rpn family recombination-promoting nuclease/putative transposase [Oscillospiraceae bacterium]